MPQSAEASPKCCPNPPYTKLAFELQTNERKEPKGPERRRQKHRFEHNMGHGGSGPAEKTFNLGFAKSGVLSLRPSSPQTTYPPRPWGAWEADEPTSR